MSEVDQLQQALERWSNGDSKSGRKALLLARAEWAPWVERFVRGGQGGERWEDVLETLLVDLLLPRPDAMPRAQAGADVGSPIAYRRTVVRRALLDWVKAARRRREGQQRLSADHRAHESHVAGAPGGSEPEAAPDELLRLRRRIATILPRLRPRARLFVAFELGIDVHVYLDAIAAELDLDAAELQALMDEVPRREDALEALLFPGGPRGSFLKARKRALQEGRDLFEEDAS